MNKQQTPLTTRLSGKWLDILQRRIRPGHFHIENGKIISFEDAAVEEDLFILPGFIDAHIHIESSMLVPYEFARIALVHGTVATVSDPHEIANVMGLDGVHYMLENARGAFLKFNFGAPSCVPATSFESAGARLGPKEVESLLQRDDILYLSEMMNYPGVLSGDEEVMEKIKMARRYGKPVDGHAPGLKGEDAKRYIGAGISTDHECFTLEEALGKIGHGMKILIREGSAARNFDALHPLLGTHPAQCMFCSDDKHPDELLIGHINQLVARSVALGYELFDILYAACIHPVLHYKLPVGLLQPGDPADFILTRNLSDFRIEKTYINGVCVAEHGKSILPPKAHALVNHFHTTLTRADDFRIPAPSEKIRLIEVYDGQLITGESVVQATSENGYLVPDTGRDILKIAVVNRYAKEKPACAFIKNFGLERGAIASSVAHDSHNIIVVGADDESICRAVNLLVAHTGGLSLVDGPEEMVIALPVAGLMSDQDCHTIGSAYADIDHKARQMGSRLRAPYMSLSFMALLVIPQLKLSDKGLFDGTSFRFTSLFPEG
ncbi:MAG: adenine deaminase [Bacteroidia bacterium]|nr:adenine deaminase [Bacteroidia bacterium]